VVLKVQLLMLQCDDFKLPRETGAALLLRGTADAASSCRTAVRCRAGRFVDHDVALMAQLGDPDSVGWSRFLESDAPRLIAHQISARRPIILKPDHGQVFAALSRHVLSTN